MRLIVLLGIAIVLAGCSGVSGLKDRSVGADSPPVRKKRDAGLEPSRRGQSVADIARKNFGAPYRWGGSSPSGFDCSGFVQYVYAQVGVSLPHSVAKQYEHGTAVSRESLEPGDLVFFDRLRHNGIYVGHGRFIHARRTGRHVNIERLDEDWYIARWVGARRL